MSHSILVFDGVCVLCSHWVGFVLRHDRHGLYKFAAMQTSTGRKLRAIVIGCSEDTTYVSCRARKVRIGF